MVSIYERLGGRTPLYRMVEEVYKLMEADTGSAGLGKFFKKEFNVQKLTKRTADFLEGEWGGEAFQMANQTASQKSSLLFQVHSSVGVSNADYKRMMQMYEKTLGKMGVDKMLKREILQWLETLRDPIVDEFKKHREKWMQKNKMNSSEEETAWQKAAELQRQQEQERRERLAAFRREKKKQEQEVKRQEQLLKKQIRKRETQNLLQQTPKVPNHDGSNEEEDHGRLWPEQHSEQVDDLLTGSFPNGQNVSLDNWCTDMVLSKGQSVIVSI
eukprot:TRINITY_DN52673_c0_g1_i1.p1 TRINITY_DN52673_c0_g1~~TRINITY_DN52673_c0_g1_i1.p1  ORF type:complete len:271 (+),score=59.56 TRINITY_DN52673_c0_g1_i1:124-936(+)